MSTTSPYTWIDYVLLGAVVLSIPIGGLVVVALIGKILWR